MNTPTSSEMDLILMYLTFFAAKLEEISSQLAGEQKNTDIFKQASNHIAQQLHEEMTKYSKQKKEKPDAV